MNAHKHPIGANVPPRTSDRPTGEAGASNLSTFSWRTDLCPDCDSATGSRGCETCEGSGEVTAACVGCFNCYPLNGDGECAGCAQLVEVEHLGPGRIAA